MRIPPAVLRRIGAPSESPSDEDTVAVGGSGFGVDGKSLLRREIERGWISRDAAIARLKRMLDVLVAARCYHGALPHFMNGVTGETVPFTAPGRRGRLSSKPRC